MGPRQRQIVFVLTGRQNKWLEAACAYAQPNCILFINDRVLLLRDKSAGLTQWCVRARPADELGE